MTNSQPQESEFEHSTFGYFNGQWIDTDQMSISIDDLGFRQAVTAVERLRTYSQRIFQVDAHLERWRHTVAELNIQGLPSADSIGELLDELITRNRSPLDQWQETGVTMVATPGAARTRQPTFALHLNRLDLALNQRRQQSGQPLVMTAARQPPAESWPRSIKVRCRLHYYLADQIAGSCFPDASAVLIDDDHTITETSIASIAIVESSVIVSPPAERILGGITQSVVQRLAKADDVVWTHEPITLDRLQQADEILLMGTDTGLWFANRVNSQLINDGKPGPVYQGLRIRFDQLTSSS